MSLHIHRAERADRLADALGDVLSTPLDDPFVTEVVAVPTQGVERWLAQSLSHRLGTSVGGRDGICAGVEFPSLRRLTSTAVAVASGVEPRADPWQPARSVWPLLAVIDRARGESWASLLWSYLGDRPDEEVTGGEASVRRGRRWSTAHHLTELFSDYASSRPGMVLSWLAGHDVDAAGRSLPSDYVWQAELWRRLRAAIDLPSPAERTADACRRLVSEPQTSDLPARLSVFGASRLSPDSIAVLSALAAHRAVHLWLSHASPALWSRLAAANGRVGSLGPRAAGDVSTLPANQLLSYLGRDIRELQLTLSSVSSGSLSSNTASVPTLDRHHPGSPEHASHPGSLLQHLQDDLAADRPPRPTTERPTWDPADRSVTLHASHGPDRQVEVLRELLVGLLADDPTLEPRDIVVMCPDIERFAPLISATFGAVQDEQTSEHPGHRLRVRLADRALRQVNPLLAALSRVLELVESRMEASDLLDLCAFPPVAHKFGFSDDDVERLHDLVSRSGVRWGLDVDHRQSFAMGQFAQNTWAAGLDRLLLGVTMDEGGQQFIGTALPLDDVDSSDVELVGRLAELVTRLRSLLAQFRVDRTLPEWIVLCQRAIELLADVPAADGWQLSHAYGQLGALGQTADVSLDGPDEGTPVELSVTEIKAMLADTFRGRATRANFRTGTLTMCTMLPMRSVPHRVICLLGVDDGVFPRRSSRDGDDILAAEPWVGDRDPRSEDRQLLLDAIMAAEDHLIVIYSGADARTRAPKPPAVPIGALLDALDLTMRTGDDRPVRDHITTVHPLQPFDPVNFVPGRLHVSDRTPFSFDAGALRGATAAAGVRRAPTVIYDADRLGDPDLSDVTPLTDLVRFFNHPVKALLRARAGLYVSREDEEPSDQIPVTLDGLESWGIGNRMLERHLEGLSVEQLRAAEWRRGSLPPRSFGSRAIGPVVDNVDQIANASRQFLSEPRSSRDVLVELGHGRQLTGTLPSVYGGRLVTVNYSWVGPKHRLQSWIELLAVTASFPEQSWQAVTLGRGRRSLLGPVPSGGATKVLADLVDLYRTGLTGPLPLGPKIGHEYARIRREGKSIANLKEKLEKTWNEERDAAYEHFFGTGVSFEQLTTRVSIPAEERGDLAEPSRLGTLARRIWHPLLESEALG